MKKKCIYLKHENVFLLFCVYKKTISWLDKMNVINENFHTVRYVFDIAMVRIGSMKMRDLMEMSRVVFAHTESTHTRRELNKKNAGPNKIDADDSLFSIINDRAYYEPDGSNAWNTGK